MNVAIGIFAGMFMMSTIIGLVYALVESFRGRASKDFNFHNPFDVMLLVAPISFIAMMACIGIAGGQS